ncbi:MAG: hypothetical protein RJQ09_18650 [Cyclobacteriaceae bacterium]
MKPHFDVVVKSFKRLSTLPGSWNSEDFKQLLDLTEYGDISDIPNDDLQDMATMALQDLDPEEAADLVIEYRLGNRLKAGQRQDLIQEMQGDEIWEEYGDMSLHEEIFNISTLMHQAFPKTFPETEVFNAELHVKAMNSDAKNQLDKINESFICRLVSDGMSDHCILYRLFDEQLAGKKFPEAEFIIWKYEVEGLNDSEVMLSLLASDYWIKELKDAGNFTSSAYNDFD